MLENLLLHFFFSQILGTRLAHATPLEPPPRARAETAVAKPMKNPYAVAPVIGAEAAVVYDAASNTILYQKNFNERRAMASLGKLVLAMVILDNHALDEKVTVGKKAADQESSKAWLAAGEEFTVADLLRATLIASANDAAMALAEFDADGDEAAFIKKMNEKVTALGLADTNFTNVVGFDTEENYSTVRDILHFSSAALAYEFIRETVKIPEATIVSLNKKIPHKLASTNHLLGNEHYKVYGIKTGTTPQAGQALAVAAEGPDGREFIAIVLGSVDRFQEMKVLLTWVYTSYQF